MLTYENEPVEMVREGIFQSVIRFTEKWQHLPNTLPYYENGILMPGQQLRAFTSEIKGIK